jgi:hypothetical protein
MYCSYDAAPSILPFILPSPRLSCSVAVMGVLTEAFRSGPGSSEGITSAASVIDLRPTSLKPATRERDRGGARRSDPAATDCFCECQYGSAAGPDSDWGRSRLKRKPNCVSERSQRKSGDDLDRVQRSSQLSPSAVDDVSVGT